MKLLIVGGGPAGLYAGLLLKKADPRRAVTIVERNAPDATYGWGVVFSERTLGGFADADAKSARAIADHLIQWDAIDIHYRGEVIRCGGQTFAGIARKTLLRILRARCEELGVALRFRTEIADLAGLAGADVVVAADGVNSGIRRALARYLRPTLESGAARYIWYGTRRWLEAFTFIFKETEWGLFQVHAYPFDGRTSTFIVECAEDVWRRAGLDRADETASLEFCGTLFHADLRGRGVMSNNSRWINFPTVKNARWHHGTVVLLGDAAHTAHFSIGSGTKLALEDAIALAQALERHRDIDGAFNDYEAARRPAVEALQQAAAESRTYFERLRRYLHLEPQQFAFHLLTRSGRITYDSLRLRDPQFGEATDRWFARVREGLAPPPVLTPIALRGATLRNRIALEAPPADDCAEGDPSRALRRAIFRRAAGAGLVLTPPVAVASDGRITPGCPGLYDPGHTEAWRSIVTAARGSGTAAVALCLNHAGPRGATRPRYTGLDRPLRSGAWPLVAASPTPYAPGGAAPAGMDRPAMDRVREAFARAARAADEAGADALLLHFGGGYLLATFISPLTNHRVDEYGGTLEGRVRYPLEVLDAVRAAWPGDRPIAVAFTADDCAPGGLPAADAVEVARRLHARGADLVRVVAGHTTAGAHPPYGRGFLTGLADLIRNDARVPVMAGGYLVTADEANTVLAAGRADLCILNPPDLDRTPAGGEETVE